MLDLGAHACNPSYLGGSWFKANLGKKVRKTLSKKITTAK
jgi:hypothetical protein